MTVDPAAVLPTIGSKELVAWLPTLLGLGSRRHRRHPRAGVPDLRGRRPAGGRRVRALRSPTARSGPRRVALLWLNSPSNPTGRVLPPAHLRKVVGVGAGAGRGRRVRRVLPVARGRHRRRTRSCIPDVCGGSHEGLLAVHSMSKSSNLAGYRAGFVAGDPALVAALLEVRKHAGMIVPFPVQAAMAAAASDDAHVVAQAALYDAAARGAAARAREGGPDRRALRGGAVPLGHRGRAVPVDGAAPGRPKVCWWHPGSSTVRRARSTCASR